MINALFFLTRTKYPNSRNLYAKGKGIKMRKFYKTGDASTQLGVSSTQLRRWADSRALPEGAVRASPSGHRQFNVSLIETWLDSNYKRQTRLSRKG